MFLLYSNVKLCVISIYLCVHMQYEVTQILLFYSDDEGTLKFDLLVWVEVFEMSPSGE